MRYRYDHRVAITGLVLGVLILAGGLLTGHRDTAGALTIATIICSTMVAYVRVPDRPTDPDRDRAGRP
jgi:hypothetical protein